MRQAFLIPVLLLTTYCASSTAPAPQPVTQSGRGAITVDIVPNPIVAQRISGDTYEFPFEVVVQETGGRPVTINRVTADVLALGAIKLGSESYDAARIQSLGYSNTVAANGTLRYRFNPRKSVADDRLFGGVSAEVRVEGTDDTGAAVTARTTVTVKR